MHAFLKLFNPSSILYEQTTQGKVLIKRRHSADHWGYGDKGLHMKSRVYFNEFNVLMEKAAYLPVVSGLLRAFAETSPDLKSHYEFMPFLFHRDSLANVMRHYADPAVAAFSVSMWNEQLNLKVAAEVKQLYPQCLVVFGGAQVPQWPEEYFKRYPFIDVAVRGEGEEAFRDILTRFLNSRDFSGIAGIAWRNCTTGACIRNVTERPQSRDLDIYPSPYLAGLYEDLIQERQDLYFQQIIETNRGCPFPCTFCFWGQGGLSRTYRYHSIERVKQEIEWGAQHSIKYIFNADSNFGMHARDAKIAQILVDTKQKYGFPEKFRTCFGKNTDKKIFEIAQLLHQHQLEKGITLARQSHDTEVLKNIKRQNIKMSAYKNLQLWFNEVNIPVYSELIVGLPGENYETWVSGLEELLEAGVKNQIFTYLCQVYPNTEMDDPEYKKKFGIVTKRLPLMEIHGAVRPKELVTEYEDVVITTESMPVEEWRKMALFSWTMMTLHSMKLGFFILYYLHDRYGVRYTDFIRYICERRMSAGVGPLFGEEISEFELQLDRVLAGEGRAYVMPEFGKIYWDVEEASFLRISSQLDTFYRQMLDVLRDYLIENGISYDEEELAEAVQYQRMRIPVYQPPVIKEFKFQFNFPEYFDTCFRTDAKRLERKSQWLALADLKDYGGDKARYARETILWGRKSGAMLVPVTYRYGDPCLDMHRLAS